MFLEHQTSSGKLNAVVKLSKLEENPVQADGGGATDHRRAGSIGLVDIRPSDALGRADPRDAFSTAKALFRVTVAQL